MDLWDVIRLMVRRWYVSVPMLLLTAGAVVWTGMTVSPNHTAEAHVMVLPPVSYPNPEAGEERIVNPWTTDSLAGAIVTVLRNHRLAEEIEAEGHRAEWEVGLDLQFLSVIRIEVTSPTEHEAQAAVSRLLQQVGHEVSARQAEFNIPEGEKITTVTLGAGENVDVVRGNQIRALVVVFGAFMILTMGLTVGVDAVARRRGVRTTRPAPSFAGGTEPPLAGAAPLATTNGNHPEYAGAGPAHGGRSQPDVGNQPGIEISYRPPPERPAAPHPGEFPAPRTDLDDSTIILPLSGTKLTQQRDRTERSTDAGHGSQQRHESSGASER